MSRYKFEGTHEACLQIEHRVSILGWPRETKGQTVVGQTERKRRNNANLAQMLTKSRIWNSSLNRKPDTQHLLTVCRFKASSRRCKCLGFGAFHSYHATVPSLNKQKAKSKTLFYNTGKALKSEYTWLLLYNEVPGNAPTTYNCNTEMGFFQTRFNLSPKIEYGR